MMSNQSTDDTSKNIAADTIIMDSGFLSSSNLLLNSSELTSDIHEQKESKTEENAPIIKPVIVETDRAPDSGLDVVSFSNNFSDMSITSENKNSQSYPVQLESDSELKPDSVVSDSVTSKQQQSQQNRINTSKVPTISWQSCFIQNRRGNTLLHEAAAKGLEPASFELIRIAPISSLLDIENNYNETPLHMAVGSHQPSIARRLVLAGCSIKKADCNGNTPLHMACSSGDINCVEAIVNPILPMERKFLKPGQRVPVLPRDLEVWNRVGKTALHVAAALGSIEIVQVLLRRGANIDNREGLEGRTALHLAIDYGHTELFKFLLREFHPCLETRMYNQYTPYQLALVVDPTYATELLAHGAKKLPVDQDSDSEWDDSESETDDSETEANNKPRQKMSALPQMLSQLTLV